MILDYIKYQEKIKMRQQELREVSLLTKIKLNVNDEMYKISIRCREEESDMC